MTKPRLDCYDAIVPPQTKLKPLPAELVVNDLPLFERGKREADLLQPICREADQASGAKGDVCRAETGRAEGRQQRRLRSMVGMGGKPLEPPSSRRAAPPIYPDLIYDRHNIALCC